MLTRRSAIGMFVAFFALVGLAPAVFAAEDANGTWKWTTPGRNGGQGREVTLTLKQDGEKLTGSITGGGGGGGGGAAAAPVEIADGKIKDGDVSFKTVRKGRNNNEITINYTGKLSGDSIKFKSEVAGGNGNQPAREFEAKRSK